LVSRDHPAFPAEPPAGNDPEPGQPCCTKKVQKKQGPEQGMVPANPAIQKEQNPGKGIQAVDDDKINRIGVMTSRQKKQGKGKK
jgi:hypothetical protein